jgi:four helix bundle protein
MIAKAVGELQVYQRARELSAAVTGILARPAFQADRRLRDEIRAATDSVESNISEGFAQSTDKAFAEYLVHAKASNAEIRTRLGFARERRYITDAELSTSDQLADEIARMLTGLIEYLRRSNLRNRGLGLNRDDDA